MRIEYEIKLGFKDVMFRPKRSTLKSRSQVSLEREFTFKNSKKTSIVTVLFSRALSKEKSNAIRIKQEVINLSTKAWQEHIRNLKPLNETIFDRLKELSNELIFVDSIFSIIPTS